MVNIKIRYQLVDTAGQITAVVFGAITRGQQALGSKKIMKSDPKIEQVVFIEDNRIQTMGNELCINGSLAGAYLLENSKVEISGLNEPITFSKQKKYISARLPLNILQRKTGNIIQLTGIVYIISNDKNFARKTYLNKLAKKYKVPASGIILYKNNRIVPVVYVKDTDTLVREKACGSGSLAYYIYSNENIIIQPSGQSVFINKYRNYFIIKSPIKIYS